MLGTSIAGAEERPSEEVPLLSRIPYLNRLFKNGSVEHAEFRKDFPPLHVQQSPSGARMVICDLSDPRVDPERIGVDFEFNVDEPAVTRPSRKAKRQRAEEEKRELLDALVQAQIENAVLKAKLEFVEERAQLVAEIARLKSEQRLAQHAAPPPRQVVETEFVEVESEVCRPDSHASDAALARQAIDLLQQNKQAGVIQYFQIDMQVDGGAVTLRGNVASDEQRDRILGIVQGMSKVKQVNNELKIKPRE
jgi:hypothetical protein